MQTQKALMAFVKGWKHSFIKIQSSTEYRNIVALLRLDKTMSNHIAPNPVPNCLPAEEGLMTEVIRLQYCI